MDAESGFHQSGPWDVSCKVMYGFFDFHLGDKGAAVLDGKVVVPLLKIHPSYDVYPEEDEDSEGRQDLGKGFA